MPQATSKPTTVEYLPLNSPSDMGNALAIALSIGFTGTLATDVTYPQAPPNEDGSPVTITSWTITLTGPNHPGVRATIGDVYVWHPDLKLLEAMNQDKFLQLYTP